MNDKVCEGRMRFGWACDRKPTIERDGKHYCWQHDPERVHRKNREKWEKEKAERAVHRAKHDARIERRLLEQKSGIAGLTNDDLIVIISFGGIREMIAQAARSKR